MLRNSFKRAMEAVVLRNSRGRASSKSSEKKSVTLNSKGYVESKARALRM